MSTSIFDFINRTQRATPEEFTAEFERLLAERRERKQKAAERAAQRWDDALALMTAEQARRVAAFALDGYRPNKLWWSRDRQRIALLLVGPQKWITARQRLLRELRIVYPDGHSASTLERTISVDKNF